MKNTTANMMQVSSKDREVLTSRRKKVKEKTEELMKGTRKAPPAVPPRKKPPPGKQVPAAWTSPPERMRIRSEDAASEVAAWTPRHTSRCGYQCAKYPLPGQGQDTSKVHEVIGATLAQCYGCFGVDKLVSPLKRFNCDLHSVQVH